MKGHPSHATICPAVTAHKDAPRQLTGHQRQVRPRPGFPGACRRNPLIVIELHIGPDSADATALRATRYDLFGNRLTVASMQHPIMSLSLGSRLLHGPGLAATGRPDAVVEP